MLAAKLAVSALAGILFGLLAEGLMAGATTAALSARGIDIQLARGDYLQLLAGGTAAAGLWAVIGIAPTSAAKSIPTRVPTSNTCS